MSIEQNLERIADALEQLVASCPLSPPKPTIKPAEDIPAASAPAPAPTPTPTPAPAPTPTPVPAGAPFSDVKGLMSYAMSAYTALGATEGAKIEGILHEFGCTDINTLDARHYDAFYAKVEALKGN